MSNKVVVDKYTIGDLATIRDYDIFVPSPSSWNSDFYGRSKTYIEGQKTIISANLDLYAQYPEVSVTYCFFDYSFESWQTTYGTDIEIAQYEFEDRTQLESFKCWLYDKKEFFPKQILKLEEFNYLFCPSCFTEYTVEFDNNGGDGEKIDSKVLPRNTYIECDGQNISIVDDIPKLVVPECKATILDHHFIYWTDKIDIYYPNQQVSITKDTKLFACWTKDIKYPVQVSIIDYEDLKINSKSTIPEDNASIKAIVDGKNGYVTVYGSIYDKIKNIEATAKNIHTHHFYKWIIENNEITSNPTELTCLQDETTLISAVFNINTKYILECKIENPSFGSVTITGDQYSKVKNVIAQPNSSEYRLKEWIGVPDKYKYSLSFQYSFEESVQDQYKQITAIFDLQDTITEIYKSGVEKPYLVNIEGNTINYQDLGKSKCDSTLPTIEKVILGSNITRIGDYCFTNCLNLKDISSKSVIGYIGKYAFSNTGFTQFDYKDLKIIEDNKNIYIQDGTFKKCDHLKKVIVPVFKQIHIGESAFYECPQLKYISNSQNKNSWVYLNGDIDQYAFFKCTSLTSVVFGPKEEDSFKIKSLAFSQCKYLLDIDLTNISQVDKIPELEGLNQFDYKYTYSSDRIFKFRNKIISRAVSTRGEWSSYATEFDPSPSIQETILEVVIDTSTIPKNLVQKKHRYISFTGVYKTGYDNRQLKVSWGDGEEDSKKNHTYDKDGVYQIKIPDIYSKVSFKNITNSYTINSKKYQTTTLTKVNQLADSISQLNNYCFYKSSLNSISIPTTIDVFGKGILKECLYLLQSSISIEDGQIFLDKWGILDDYSIVNLRDEETLVKELNIPNNIIYVRDWCFNNCYNLQIIRVPETVIGFGNNLQIGIDKKPNLQSVIVDSNNPYFDSRNNCNAIIESSTNKLIAGYTCSEIPSGVKSIGKKAFNGSFKEKYNLPSSIENIERNAFYLNTELQQISFEQTSLTREQVIQLLQTNKIIAECFKENWLDDINQELKKKRISVIGNGYTLDYDAFSNDNISRIQNQNQSSKDYLDKVRVLLVANGDGRRGQNKLLGLSRDADDLETFFSSYSNNVVKLKDNQTTKSNVKTEIQNAINDSNCDLFVYVYCGSGGEKNNKQYMYLYDQDFYDNEFWQLIQDAKCKIVCIFGCCHAETMFQTQMINNSNDENKVNLDFAQSANKFFNPIDNNLLKANSGPKLLVWSACKDAEVSWCLTTTEKSNNDDWATAIQRVGHQLVTQFLYVFQSMNTYSQLWNSLSREDDNYARLNQHRVEFADDYEEFKKQTSSSKWYEWNGPTPSKTCLNGFDESIVCFTNTNVVFDVIVDINDSNAGSVSKIQGSPSSVFILTATPNSGYQFISWTYDGQEYTQNPFQIDISTREDQLNVVDITAEFRAS